MKERHMSAHALTHTRKSTSVVTSPNQITVSTCETMHRERNDYDSHNITAAYQIMSANALEDAIAPRIVSWNLLKPLKPQHLLIHNVTYAGRSRRRHHRRRCCCRRRCRRRSDRRRHSASDVASAQHT